MRVDETCLRVGVEQAGCQEVGGTDTWLVGHEIKLLTNTCVNVS